MKQHDIHMNDVIVIVVVVIRQVQFPTPNELSHTLLQSDKLYNIIISMSEKDLVKIKNILLIVSFIPSSTWHVFMYILYVWNRFTHKYTFWVRLSVHVNGRLLLVVLLYYNMCVEYKSASIYAHNNKYVADIKKYFYKTYYTS
jgi:hypothetical protein